MISNGSVPAAALQRRQAQPRQRQVVVGDDEDRRARRRVEAHAHLRIELGRLAPRRIRARALDLGGVGDARRIEAEAQPLTDGARQPIAQLPPAAACAPTAAPPAVADRSAPRQLFREIHDRSAEI